MHDELVGYLLGALEQHEAERVEQSLQDNCELQALLERLRRSLGFLQCRDEHADAPRGLASRTCYRIREVRFQLPSDDS